MTRPSRFWRPALALVVALSQAAPAGACEFRAPATWRLDFGTLAPDSGRTVRQTAFANFSGAGVGNCDFAISMQITVQPNENAQGGQLRLRHESGQSFIPYSLSFRSPITSAGPGRYVPLHPLTGEIQGSAYRNALAGRYTDTVILQVTP